MTCWLHLHSVMQFDAVCSLKTWALCYTGARCITLVLRSVDTFISFDLHTLRLGKVIEVPASVESRILYLDWQALLIAG
jgi:hypothetical protein